mmetsp:Transcript_110032/g.164660  ORF Transcript_110032/g.164660 Transcript_110032/m.164660 type:complete len:116 (+) Transcript_110032:870-1217(+)
MARSPPSTPMDTTVEANGERASSQSVPKKPVLQTQRLDAVERNPCPEHDESSGVPATGRRTLPSVGSTVGSCVGVWVGNCVGGRVGGWVGWTDDPDPLLEEDLEEELPSLPSLLL